MEQLYGVHVDFEEAKKLADLTSVFVDLSFVSKALQRLVELLESKSEDNLMIQSVWTAALITYVRCFSSGKRYGLTEDIYKTYDGALECHNFYKNMRDKHIAHSVNPFEQVAVDLQLSNPESGTREVLGVGVYTMKHITQVVEGVRDLLKLTQIALKEVSAFCESYQQKVLEVGRSLSIDTLYSKARSRLVAPGPEEASKAR